MNKSDLIQTLIDRHHDKRESITLSKADMEAVMDSLEEAVHMELAAGGEVTLPGIGKLTVKGRAGRTGRNPQTGEPIEIRPKRVPHFSAAKALREAADR